MVLEPAAVHVAATVVIVGTDGVNSIAALLNVEELAEVQDALSDVTV